MDIPQAASRNAALLPLIKPDRRYLIAGQVITVFALVSIPYRSISIFAPGLIAVMGGKQAAMGMIFTAASFGLLIGGLLGGFLSDRFHPWYVMRTTLVSLATLFTATLLLPALPLLKYAVFVISLATSVGSIAQIAMLRQLTPAHPRKILSLNFAVISIVGIAIPVIASAVYNYTLNNPALELFGMLKILYAVVGVVLLTGFLVMPKPRTMLFNAKTAQSATHQNTRITPSIIIGALLLGGLHGGFDTATYSWAPTFFTRTFAVRPFEPAWILSGYSVSYVVGRLLLTLFPETKWERLLLIIPGILGGILLLFGFTASSYTLAAGLYIAASLCYGLELPVFFGVLAKQAPHAMGRTVAISLTAAYAVGACLNSLVGVIGDATGDLRNGMMILPFGFIMFGIVAWVWTTTWGKPTVQKLNIVQKFQSKSMKINPSMQFCVAESLRMKQQFVVRQGD